MSPDDMDLVWPTAKAFCSGVLEFMAFLFNVVGFLFCLSLALIRFLRAFKCPHSPPPPSSSALTILGPLYYNRAAGTRVASVVLKQSISELVSITLTGVLESLGGRDPCL